jgi:hypothetical protein
MLSVIARLFTYIGTAAAVPVFRKRFGVRPGMFRMPFGATIPVLSLLLCIVFMASATWQNLVAGAIGLVVGAILYRFRRQTAD